VANLKALHLAGESLAEFLRRSYDKTGPKALADASFKQFGTGDLPKEFSGTPTIGLVLYRVGWNEHLRTRAPGAGRRTDSVSLDLYYLITAWGTTALAEQIPFAWTLLQLHQYPVLDRSVLRGDGGWSAEDRIEVTPQNLPHEEMARIWDKLASPYRLSAAYVARVLHMEPMKAYEEYAPVVARKAEYETRVPEELVR